MVICKIKFLFLASGYSLNICPDSINDRYALILFCNIIKCSPFLSQGRWSEIVNIISPSGLVLMKSTLLIWSTLILGVVSVASIAHNVQGLAFGGGIINVPPGPLPIY